MGSTPTIKKGGEIPQWGGFRERPDALHIPWDDLTPTPRDAPAAKDHMHIPRAFWIERGVRAATLATDTGVANVKDKLRRNFYRWRRADPTRKVYTVTFRDVWARGKYAGVDVFLIRETGRRSGGSST